MKDLIDLQKKEIEIIRKKIYKDEFSKIRCASQHEEFKNNIDKLYTEENI